MANLKTKYMGLELSNPIIAGSSAMSKTLDGVKHLAEAGVGAVVLKSLFEEEVLASFAETHSALADYHGHPDAYEYLQAGLATHYGPEKYLRLVEQASKAVSIPVIASVNCSSPDTWLPYARQIEAAGAHAIELNIYMLPTDPRVSSDDMEAAYVKALKDVKQKLTIPVAVKMVPYITNLPRLALQLGEAGASGLVLFNRFFNPDVNIESMELTGGLSLSEAQEYRLPLRWLALLYGRVRPDLCASTGIHDGDTVVRMLLAGARAVQVTSALYKVSTVVVQDMLQSLGDWMGRHQMNEITDFVGKASRYKAANPALLERSQYIRAFVEVE